MPDDYAASQSKHAQEQAFVRNLSRLTGAPPGQIRQAIRQTDRAVAKLAQKPEGTVPGSLNIEPKIQSKPTAEPSGFRAGDFSKAVDIRGKDGKDGDKGDIGAQGDKGDKGDKGDTGDTAGNGYNYGPGTCSSITVVDGLVTNVTP